MANDLTTHIRGVLADFKKVASPRGALAKWRPSPEFEQLMDEMCDSFDKEDKDEVPPVPR